VFKESIPEREWQDDKAGDKKGRGYLTMINSKRRLRRWLAAS